MIIKSHSRVGEYLQWVKEPTCKVKKNAVAVVHTNSNCKEEVAGHMQQKSPWLHSCFYRCTLDIFATGKRVNHGGEYRLEIPPHFNFCEPEKAINLAKN